MGWSPPIKIIFITKGKSFTSTKTGCSPSLYCFCFPLKRTTSSSVSPFGSSHTRIYLPKTLRKPSRMRVYLPLNFTWKPSCNRGYLPCAQGGSRVGESISLHCSLWKPSNSRGLSLHKSNHSCSYIHMQIIHRIVLVIGDYIP